MVWVHNAAAEIDARSQWPTILAVCLTLTIIMMATVGLRGYIRVVMLKTVGIDDWVIFFSAVCSIIYNGLAVGQTKWGLGLDLADRPKVNINNYAVINFTGRPFYMIGITGFKVALCVSYLRILNQSNALYKKIIYFIMISCVVLHLAGTLVLILQCKPVHKSWRPLTPGTCLPNDKTFYALAAVTIFYDCTIFLLPIPILLKLQINIRRKVALIGMFVLGLFTTICSIMRMIQIITIAKTGNSTMLVLWGTIEMNVGIFITCLPTLTPLFTYFREKSTIRYGYKSSTNQSGSGHHHSHHDHKPSNSHALSVLKSQPRARIADVSTEPWKDRDNSSDTSSQQGIIDPDKHGMRNVDGFGSDDEVTRVGKNAIRATTKVEVSISSPAVDEQERFQRKAKWGGV